MKRIAWALAWVVVVAAACGGGTLGTPGAGGNGVGVLDGVGGVGPGAGVGGVAGGAANSGFAGDGISPPGGIGGVSSGRGGFSGFGGASMVCPPPPPPVCGVQCGNGFIDTCTRGIVPECTPYTQAEECDGNAFADSCTNRGYGSGVLTCTNVCTADDSTCSDCKPNGASLLDCRPAPITFPDVIAFAIAATDNEVGLAQIDQSLQTYGSRLTFARLDSKLALINAVGLEDTAQPGPFQGIPIFATAVAATSSGWLIAGCSGIEGFVHAVDAGGKKVGRAVVPNNDSTCLSGSGLSLVPSQAGGPTLLLWRTYYDGFAALVRSDLSVSLPTHLGSLSDLAGGPSAVWSGDAFYVEVPIPGALRVLRIATDGTKTTVADILKGESLLAPSFVQGASDMRLTYTGLPVGGRNELDYAVLWRRLASSGQPLTPPVTVGIYPNFLGRSPAVAFGDDTVVLLNGSDEEELAVARIDRDGKVVKPAFDIATSPYYGLSQYDMVRRGTEVVVGWLRPGQYLKLARVMP